MHLEDYLLIDPGHFPIVLPPHSEHLLDSMCTATKIPCISVFHFWELRGLSTNFHMCLCKSLTDTCMLKFGLWLRNSFSGIFVPNFRYWFFCSVVWRCKGNLDRSVLRALCACEKIQVQTTHEYLLAHCTTQESTKEARGSNRTPLPQFFLPVFLKQIL
jgi:hypothetical protein